jgi:hypothetical protein
MTCRVVDFGDGRTAIIRVANQRPRKCSVCTRQLKDWKLCDFPAGPGKTCDRVLCAACATHKEPDTDYCPQHSAMLTPEGRLKL